MGGRMLILIAAFFLHTPGVMGVGKVFQRKRLPHSGSGIAKRCHGPARRHASW